MLLLRMNDGATPSALLNDMPPRLAEQGWRLERRVSEMLNTWALYTDSTVNSDAMLAWLNGRPGVRCVQKDHLLEARAMPPDSFSLPDDPLLPQQWQFQNTGQNGGLPGADLSAFDAWNITTGGVTPAGDTIVVAVIDGGLAYNHPDLAGNLWHNILDTPGDDLDNDDNGYVDDYRGWNVYQQNDNITGISTSHGTPIAGIIGAQTNNALGVAGVNWHVKTMFVAGKGQESVLLQAYDYIWNARKRYNQSNGTTGAFVVAVNCSWGVDYGQPADAPLWCAAFDSLGAVGILSVSATANLPVNVDQVGDLPGNCPSPFLVAVTSMNRYDEKANDAAWGPINVDLGAYGAEVFTLNNDNNYGAVSGTSFAAPHVSGAIGLLYSAPCPNLVSIAKSNPQAAALWVRGILLENTIPVPALSGKVNSSGRLDLYEVLSGYQSGCSPCPQPFAIAETLAGTGSVQISWSGIAEYTGVNLRWRLAGASTWNLLTNVTSPLVINGLEPCSNYEFTLRANCGELGFSNWTELHAFTTDGCCAPPVSFSLTDTTPNSAILTWNYLTAAQQYHLQIRKQGDVFWSDYWVPSPQAALSGLLPCTGYEVQVQTQCDTGLTVFSSLFYFETPGCGACRDLPYCNATSDFGWEEWIAKMTLGNWQHVSGGSQGYQDFSGLAGGPPVLLPLSEIPVSITPAFSGLPYNQYFRIYIDYNSDGTFSNPGEIAFDPGFANAGEVTGVIQVPDFTTGGLTRMRVMMKYKTPFNEPPGPCETFDYGEVEDYCVLLNTNAVQTGQKKDEAELLKVYPLPAQGDWVTLKCEQLTCQDATISVADMSGRTLLEKDVHFSPEGIFILNVASLNAGIYLVRVEAQGRAIAGKLWR